MLASGRLNMANLTMGKLANLRIQALVLVAL